MVKELIDSKEELLVVAHALKDEIREQDGVVSRYKRVASDTVAFRNGRRTVSQKTSGSRDRELMAGGIFTCTAISDLCERNLREVGVQMDLNANRFSMQRKDLPLPTNEFVSVESIPTNVGMYDAEFRAFTKSHPDASLRRSFFVEQRVVVNSDGGVAVQSIPYFSVSFDQGFSPISTYRDITVVASSAEDIARLPAMIKFLSDPSPDKRIKTSKSFSEAFHHLYEMSRLRFRNLPEAGIPLAGLYDVIMMSGVPVHEIFGHHFEEPTEYLSHGQAGTFQLGQSQPDKNLVMADDPHQTAEGFRLRGFTNIDAYGRPRTKQIHVANGEVVGFLGGEYVDRSKIRSFMGSDGQFTGGSLSHMDGTMPMNRMTCTVLDGKAEPVDLEGKLVVISGGGSTNGAQKTYSVTGGECYVIRNGEPMRVPPLKVTGGIHQALSNLVILDDWTYVTGMCGKGDQVLQAIANMPVSQLTRSQVWRGQQVSPQPISEPHLNVLTTNRDRRNSGRAYNR